MEEDKLNKLLKVSAIRKQTEFKQVFSSGTKMFSNYFNLYYSNYPMLCLGIQINKRIIPTAVKRNYLRRLVREHVRLAQHQLPKMKLVFSGKREASTATKEELHQCLEKFINVLINQYKKV